MATERYDEKALQVAQSCLLMWSRNLIGLKQNFLNYSLETKKHSKSGPIWKHNERLLFCCDDPILTVKSLKSGFNFVFNLGLRDLYTGQHTNQWSLINLAKATRLHHALELFGWSKPTRKIIPPVSSAYKSKCRIYNHQKFSLYWFENLKNWYSTHGMSTHGSTHVPFVLRELCMSRSEYSVFGDLPLWQWTTP